MPSGTSVCARGSNPDVPVYAENITLQLRGKFAAVKELQVWYSDMSHDEEEFGNNPNPDKLFIKKRPLTVGSDGTVNLTMLPNDLYTLTTLTTGQKGSRNSGGKKVYSPFPLPFHQTFDDEAIDKPARYWYTQVGLVA